MAQSMQSDWQARWANARAYTLAVAEAMPASDYGFRPDYPNALRPAMTFGEQLVHLGRNIEWVSADKLLGGATPPRPDIDPADKSAVIAYLDAMFALGKRALGSLSFAELDERVDWFGEGERLSKRRVGLLLFDHVTHHRAQAIVYLRVKGVAAPEYVGW